VHCHRAPLSRPAGRQGCCGTYLYCSTPKFANNKVNKPITHSGTADNIQTAAKGCYGVQGLSSQTLHLRKAQFTRARSKVPVLTQPPSLAFCSYQDSVKGC